MAMVGYCHGGNVPASHVDHHNDDDHNCDSSLVTCDLRRLQLPFCLKGKMHPIIMIMTIVVIAITIVTTIATVVAMIASIHTIIILIFIFIINVIKLSTPDIVTILSERQILH